MYSKVIYLLKGKYKNIYYVVSCLWCICFDDTLFAVKDLRKTTITDFKHSNGQNICREKKDEK